MIYLRLFNLLRHKLDNLPKVPLTVQNRARVTFIYI